MFRWMIAPLLAVTLVGSLLGSAGPAAAQTCTNRVTAPPGGANGASVRILDSSTTFNSSSGVYEETVCFVLANAGPSQLIEIQFGIINDLGPGIRIPRCFGAVTTQPLSGGLPATCIPVGSGCRTGEFPTLLMLGAGGTLPADSYTDQCCVTYRSTGCLGLPEEGDVLNVEPLVPFAPAQDLIIQNHNPTGSCNDDGGGQGALLLMPVWLWMYLGSARRRGRLGPGRIGLPLLLAVGIVGLAASAAAQTVTLNVDPAATSLTGTLNCGGQQTLAVTPTGSINVSLTIQNDRATQLQVSSGAIQDSFSFPICSFGGGGVTLTQASVTNAVATVESGQVTTTAAGANTATFDPPLLDVELVSGNLDVTGNVFGGPVLTAEDFSASQEPNIIANVTDQDATIATVPNGSGGYDVTLTIPVEAANQPVDECSFVWLFLDGTLVLTGTLAGGTPTPVGTASPRSLLLAALGLLGVGILLSWRLRRARSGSV